MGGAEGESSGEPKLSCFAVFVIFAVNSTAEFRLLGRFFKIWSNGFSSRYPCRAFSAKLEWTKARWLWSRAAP